ncbi:uncharacterized protein N7515_000059 [Penicillium bovifimosum]|uniref:Uncharacterized protein n=1 Tax=Penicillium bovifimosum TaxID=126998 RepID=A0A9W9LB33_9EURO|nr:uncharacterized protein N7515_000059 [Penicillium bovifimosum]KAJ5145495.1 hypothetical protein N7515_000059 [Penicillium bovifimosum]
MYELFTDTESPDSWMKHAKGLGQLARIRGPDRYNTELDMALLKASRGVIVSSIIESSRLVFFECAKEHIDTSCRNMLIFEQVMHAMFSGEECFLASDQWHDIMLRRFNEDLPEGLYYSIEEFFAYMTYAPDLVHKLYSLRNPGVTCAEKSQRVPELVIQALEMQTKLATWYERFSHIAPTPTETISSTGDELYPIVLTYMDVNCATIYCGYYAYMVIIHEVLRSCGYPGEHDAMVVYFRDQICKSVEYNTRGLLGPYRMGFPLRVVFEIADPVTKAWVLDRLEHLSKSYAAMRPENYKTVL